MLAKKSDGTEKIYDFFVQTPMERKSQDELNFFPISADFGITDQIFHIGPGSVGVPGTVKGIFRMYEDLCTIPFKELSEDAIRLAHEGIVMNPFQSGAFDIVKAAYRWNKEASAIFKSAHSQENLIREGELLKQPELAGFIENLTEHGPKFFYEGDIAKQIASVCKGEGGLLSEEDLREYGVVVRDPLQFSYRNSVISINPPPSVGGLLIGLALKKLEREEKLPDQNSYEFCKLIAQVQDLTHESRIKAEVEKRSSGTGGNEYHKPFLELYKDLIKGRQRTSHGTTQITVVDSAGQMASLTTSNGSASGVMIPGTGVMLNNMLGEEDLNRSGFFKWTPNKRISSMMAPVIAERDDGVGIVFGSGGSNRIRTAILQVLVHLIDGKMSLRESVKASRLHYENEVLNIESGLSEEVYKKLKTHYPQLNYWEEPNLFFGGTHACIYSEASYECFGDPRRGGHAITVS